jgi:hypothetical protein
MTAKMDMTAPTPLTVTLEDGASVGVALDLAGRGMDVADALHLARSIHCTDFATVDRIFVSAATGAGFEDVRQA